MKKIDLLRKKRENVVEVLQLIDNEISTLQSKTKVECTDNFQYGSGCGKKTEIRNLEYIQTHWYTRPFSCTEGDYWNEGEGNFICPKCNHRNRLYNREEIQDLKELFMSVKDIYERWF